MRIHCQQCAKGFTVPDEKVPDNDVLRFKCPACGGKNELDTREQAGPAGQVAGDAPADQAQAEEMLEPEIYPPGAEVVFIFVSHGEWSERVQEYLTQMGMYQSTAETVEQARQKLNLNRYNWVILEDRAENAPLLQEIASWPGFSRREVNCLLVGNAARSFDPNEAFVKGMNCYLAFEDEERVEELLEQARDEYNQYLAPWQVAMEQVEV
jgi:hypothetical protein